MAIKRKGLIFIFDIDGTLASKDYPYASVTSIPPIRETVRVALAAQRSSKSRMVIITARPEYMRKDTEVWIKKQGLKPEFLLMRSDRDMRPDPEVRVDQVEEVMRRLGDNVVLYEDKESNCKAVRKN